jgi:hypothetical protein
MGRSPRPSRWRSAIWSATWREGGEGVAIARCAAITRGGTRCKLGASHGSYCRQHAPELADERRRNASRGGRTGGRGRRTATFAEEIRAIRGELAELYADALSGEIDRGVAAVGAQIQNVRLRAVEVARKLKEEDELEERIAVMEERLRRYGA